MVSLARAVHAAEGRSGPDDDHEYTRNGPTDLFAALNIATGEIVHQTCKPHRAGVGGHPLLALLAADQRRFAMADDALGPWDPMVPEDAAVEFGDWAVPWWVAGGWAIDLLLGHQTRAHGDLDILILRRDHGLVRTYLEGWDVCSADPPGALRRWRVGETLPEHVHDVWCRRRPDSAWEFQLMIRDAEGDGWIFRRYRRLRRSIESLTSRVSSGGVPVLSLEIQLLYKSRGLRDKDLADSRRYEATSPQANGHCCVRGTRRRRRGWGRCAVVGLPVRFSCCRLLSRGSGSRPR